jgi:hypothetical protein
MLKKISLLILVLISLSAIVSAIQVCQVYDDFESGNANNWVNSTGDWKVVNDNGNYVYRQDMLAAGGGLWKASTLDFYAEGYSAEADIRFIEVVSGSFGGVLGIYKKTNGFFSPVEPVINIALFPRYNQISLYVQEEGVPTREYTYSTPLETNKWYHIGVSVENGLASAWFEGQKIISDVPTYLNKGYVSIHTDGVRADFDNIKICKEIPDSDNDGVPDNEDKCPNTILPEIFIKLNPNNYGDIDGDKIFETVAKVKIGKKKIEKIIDSKYSLVDTYGCSCHQILDIKPGKDSGELKNGCSKGTLENFIYKRGWAKNLFKKPN